MRPKEAAKAVLKTYGNSLEGILTALGLKVLEFRLAGRLKEIYLGKHIVLKESLSPFEKRVLIAHALGHHFLHKGNHLYFAERGYIWNRRQEYEAEVFAAYLLIPEEVLNNLPHLSLWELAKHLKVPEDLMRFRLSLD